MCERLVLYQTVLSDTPEIRSLKPRLDRGEARALSFSKECQSLWLYMPIDYHHASKPCTGNRFLIPSALVLFSSFPPEVGGRAKQGD